MRILCATSYSGTSCRSAADGEMSKLYLAIQKSSSRNSKRAGKSEVEDIMLKSTATSDNAMESMERGNIIQVDSNRADRYIGQ